MSGHRTASEAIREAREKLSFERLINELGYQTGKNAPCPFCAKRGSASLFSRVGASRLDRPKFKCFKPQCVANQSMDDVQFLAAARGLSSKEAFKEFLRLAGVH